MTNSKTRFDPNFKQSGHTADELAMVKMTAGREADDYIRRKGDQPIFVAYFAKFLSEWAGAELQAIDKREARRETEAQQKARSDALDEKYLPEANRAGGIWALSK